MLWIGAEQQHRKVSGFGKMDAPLGSFIDLRQSEFGAETIVEGSRAAEVAHAYVDVTVDEAHRCLLGRKVQRSIGSGNVTPQPWKSEAPA
jgi:hypothetical protein